MWKFPETFDDYFTQENLPLIPSAVNVRVIHEMLLKAQSTPPGCFVEIGVDSGGTASRLTHLAQKQQRQIYLYDTFAGIPNHTPGKDRHQIGDFAPDKDRDYFNEVKTTLPYADVVKGVFPDSIVDMPPIAFVHLDCDQYQSVIESYAVLKDKMVPGGIIWFDDAVNENHASNGAWHALFELYPNLCHRADTHCRTCISPRVRHNSIDEKPWVIF
jgi:hypothetical protein